MIAGPQRFSARYGGTSPPLQCRAAQVLWIGRREAQPAAYSEDPRKTGSGNRLPFFGVHDAANAQPIAAYLATLKYVDANGGGGHEFRGSCICHRNNHKFTNRPNRSISPRSSPKVLFPSTFERCILGAIYTGSD